MDLDHLNILVSLREDIDEKRNYVKRWITSSERNQERFDDMNLSPGKAKDMYVKTLRKWKKVRAANNRYSALYDDEYYKIRAAFDNGDEELFKNLTEDGLDYLLSKMLLKYISKHLKKIDSLHYDLRRNTWP